jgi:hypothetical protein
MLLLWLATISASQIPTGSGVGRTDLPPGVKECADGATVLVADSCPPQFPDHRYLLTHEPRRQIVSAEWWCQGEPSPTSVRFSVEASDTRNAVGKITGLRYSVSLFSLRVSGRAASTTQLSRVRQSLPTFNNIGFVHGRCLHTPAGRTIPVLTFAGYTKGIIAPQRVELELR